jgi:hypothetical protein
VTDPLPRSLGIGHLAAAAFPQLWNRTGDGAVAHLRRYAAFDGWVAVTGYAVDARCLLATDLTAEELEMIWCSCTGGNHRPGRDGLSGREWIQTVYDVMAARADATVMGRLEDAGHSPELAGRVLRVVEQFRVRDTFSLCDVPDDAARAALAKVVRAGFADLALRLFLAMVSAHLPPLSTALFHEVADLARRMGHDDDIVSGLAFLVQRE